MHGRCYGATPAPCTVVGEGPLPPRGSTNSQDPPVPQPSKAKPMNMPIQPVSGDAGGTAVTAITATVPAVLGVLLTALGDSSSSRNLYHPALKK